jgi:predicted DNA-binding transcriptional regulator AlpA
MKKRRIKKEVAALVGVSRSMLWYMEKCGLDLKNGRITESEINTFLDAHPHPCAEWRKKKPVNTCEHL